MKAFQGGGVSLREVVSDLRDQARADVSRSDSGHHDDHGHDEPGYFPHDQFSDVVLRADIPGGTSTTTTLRPGGSLTAEIETRGDHDWFRVELTAGQTYVFNTGAGSNGQRIDTTLALRNGSGTTIASNDDANGGTLSQITFTASSTGVYYLDVGTYQNQSTGQYSVSMTGQTAPPSGLPVFTNNQIANQLTDGFWGGNDRSFNVNPGGTLTVNLTALTAAGQVLAREALNLWTDVTGVNFQTVTSGGSILFDDNQSGAFASSSVSGATITSSRVNVGTDWLSAYGTGINTYSFQTYVHEIGHALGLGHAGNYNGSASYPNDALYANDSWATTVMSYFDQGQNTYFADQGFTRQFALTPMVADGVAMATLYGTSSTTRTGDTVYGFGNTSGRAVYDSSANPNVSYTVYDSGGVDTLNYSGFSAAQTINLNAETFSNVGGRVGNVSIARGTVIENATGGSGNDVLIGNAVANVLVGGAGTDRYTGGGGNDVFRGTSVQLGGDTIVDLTVGDRLHITDGTVSSVSVSGSTVNLGGGRTLTLSNGSGGQYSVTAASDGGVNVVRTNAAAATAPTSNAAVANDDFLIADYGPVPVAQGDLGMPDLWSSLPETSDVVSVFDQTHLATKPAASLDDLFMFDHRDQRAHIWDLQIA